MSDLVLKSKADGVFTITLNRPNAINALSKQLLLDLDAAVDEAAADEETNVILIKANGAKGFCAGLDTKELATRREAGEDTMDTFNVMYGLAHKIDMLPKMVVSALHGHCIAAGAQIGTAADIVIASDNLKLLENEMRGGGFNDDSWARRLGKIIGPVRAKAYVFLMETLTAEEAKALGLVSKVVPDAELDSYADAISLQLAKYHQPAARKALAWIEQGAGRMPMP